MGLAIVGYGMSFAIDAAAAPETVGTSAATAAAGFKLSSLSFAYGLSRFVGQSKQSVYEDAKDIVLPPSVDVAKSLKRAQYWC